MINNIIHQIWIQGYDKMPKKLQEYNMLCKEVNNNFKHIFWDNTKIINFIKENYPLEYLNLYNSYNVPAQKSDIARYLILYKLGGIYLDTDMVCRKNLSDFLNNKFFSTSYIMPDYFKRYLNGVIGTEAGHPVFEYIFKNIFERKNKANDITYSTGTSLFYDSIKEYQTNNPDAKDISIIDMKYLHPCHVFNKDNCALTCNDCYISHMNTSSWNNVMRHIKPVVQNIEIVLIVIIIIILLYLFLKNK